MGILWAHMERLERNAWIGVLNWLSLSILVLLGLCANNQMLHTQWYWFFIFPFYMTKMLQCMDSQKIKKIKCCNIIICVYFNLAKKCVYIFYYYFHFFLVHFTFLCRLILAMGDIVISSPQTVPIVLKSGQRIGLAGISFYYFLWFTIYIYILDF